MAGTIKVLATCNDIIHISLPQNLNLDTCFRLASVSKQFTSLSILILVNSNFLNLNDLVNSYLPSLSWSKSTILHLLTHTSDIQDCYDDLDENVEYSNSMLLPFLKSNSSISGTTYIYNNTGYDLIPLIIEVVTGVSYTTFVRKHIFEPLALSRTFTALEIANVDNVASSYSSESGSTYGYHHLNKILGSGGIYSSASNLIIWNCYMHHLVASPLIQIAKSEMTSNYGLGFEVYSDHIAHSGSWQGYNTYLAFYPCTKLSVIVLSNIDSVDSENIGKNLSPQKTYFSIKGGICISSNMSSIIDWFDNYGNLSLDLDITSPTSQLMSTPGINTPFNPPVYSFQINLPYQPRGYDKEEVSMIISRPNGLPLRPIDVYSGIVSYYSTNDDKSLIQVTDVVYEATSSSSSNSEYLVVTTDLNDLGTSFIKDVTDLSENPFNYNSFYSKYISYNDPSLMRIVNHIKNVAEGIVIDWEEEEMDGDDYFLTEEQYDNRDEIIQALPYTNYDF